MDGKKESQVIVDQEATVNMFQVLYTPPVTPREPVVIEKNRGCFVLRASVFTKIIAAFVSFMYRDIRIETILHPIPAFVSLMYRDILIVNKN